MKWRKYVALLIIVTFLAYLLEVEKRIRRQVQPKLDKITTIYWAPADQFNLISYRFFEE